MSSSLESFQYVAGVFPVGEHVKEPEVMTQRDLFSHEPIGHARAWDVLPENDTDEDRAYWRHAGRATNEMLVAHLRNLQDRSADEYLGNPTIEGVIAKHVVDTVGADGPTLQIQSIDWDDPDYAREYEREVEMMWKEVATSPTADGEDSWGEWIGSALIEDWLSGGTTDQIVKDTAAPHPIKTRLHPIDILRLDTPTDLIGDPNTLLGITRNQFGRPVKYHFANQIDLYNFGATFEPVPADQIIHGFIRRRRTLVRGYPMLAGVLAVAADLRKLDQSVLDIAQVAALMHVFCYTTSDLVDPPSKDQLESPIKYRRKSITRVPNHFQLDSLQSNQPAPQYGEYRRERSADVGRPAAMPGLAVHMDASGHNYSSARFDDRGYWRAIDRWRGHCERKRMNLYTGRVIEEAEEKRLVRPRMGRIELVWQWPKSDGIDPLKDAMSRRQRLENFSASPYDIAAEEGKDFESIARAWKKATDLLKELGLPMTIGGIKSENDDPYNQNEDEMEDD